MSESDKIHEKVVICGSLHPSNLGNFLKAIVGFQGQGFEVFPTVADLTKRLPLILQRHVHSNDSEDLLKIQGVRVWEWLREIAEADIVFFVNEKEGDVYLGHGSTLELGFALAYEKAVMFLHKPVDDSLLAVVEFYQQV